MLLTLPRLKESGSRKLGAANLSGYFPSWFFPKNTRRKNTLGGQPKSTQINLAQDYIYHFYSEQLVVLPSTAKVAFEVWQAAMIFLKMGLPLLQGIPPNF
ncbi:hypothetical protein [Maribacter sp. 4G9]|uniref:hypothetical protein n=1 Tax=Maribacter sp. 4G9 TaxID=1889777 RepID=UPI000C1529DC|nr:hypothetical protein [Maribacter sp. 4G9]PIB39086.1 hypothetical protein BFP75_01000 [Maribacter sp. 4G9]